MNIFYSVERKDNKVLIWLDSNLGSCKPIIPFTFTAPDQEVAELYKRHFENKIHEHNCYVAKEAMLYGEPEDISRLKKELNQHWNGKKHCWK